MCVSVYTSIFSSQRKKKLADSASSTNEPKSQGTSLPPSKKQRLPVVKVRDAPDRTTMTMRELIYYNPTANPMRYAYMCVHVHCTFVCVYMYTIRESAKYLTIIHVHVRPLLSILCIHVHVHVSTRCRTFFT